MVKHDGRHYEKILLIIGMAAITLGTVSAYAAPADDTYFVSEIGVVDSKGTTQILKNTSSHASDFDTLV